MGQFIESLVWASIIISEDLKINNDQYFKQFETISDLNISDSILEFQLMMKLLKVCSGKQASAGRARYYGS